MVSCLSGWALLSVSLTVHTASWPASTRASTVPAPLSEPPNRCCHMLDTAPRRGWLQHHYDVVARAILPLHLGQGMDQHVPIGDARAGKRLRPHEGHGKTGRLAGLGDLRMVGR